MTRRIAWQVVLRSALLWAVGGPLLVVTLCGMGAMLTVHAGVTPGIPALLAVAPIFVPGAAVSGGLSAWLLLWVSRHTQSLAALRIRGLVWGAGLGLLGFLLGFLLLVVLTQGEGPERGWGEMGWRLLTVPVQRPAIMGAYAVIALSGALLGWIVAGWAAQASSSRLLSQQSC